MSESLGKKKYFRELINNQIKNIKLNRKLLYKDMDRITKYINSSIFGKKCCIWNGYITNSKKTNKGVYTNFFFRNKKVALHRLLYENFIDELGDDYYLKFICPEENKGKCCNINHMIKFKYNVTEINETDDIINKKNINNDENIEIKITFD
jgi:hypothetical protein